MLNPGFIFIHLHGLAIDPNDDDKLYLGSVHDAYQPITFNLTGAHIFRTTDGGATWTESSQGFPIATETSIGFILVDPTDSNVVYVATTVHESSLAIGVYKSTDAGITWAAAKQRLGQPGHSTPGRPTRLTPARYMRPPVAGFSRPPMAVPGGSKLARGYPPTMFLTLAISPINPNILYAATAAGVFKTKNGATSWYPVSLGLPLGGQVPTMGHHLVLSLGATGSVLFAVAQVGSNEFEAQRLVYRSVLTPLSEVQYTYSLDVGSEAVEVGFESTSSIYDVSFDSDQEKLALTAAGPSGTTGRTQVQVPRSLLKGPFTVTLDGEPLGFDLDAAAGAHSAITISYSHSVHQVEISGTAATLSVIDVSAITQRCDSNPIIPAGGYQGLLTGRSYSYRAPISTKSNSPRHCWKEMNANGVDRVVVQPNHNPTGNVDQNKGVDGVWGEIGSVCSRLIPMILWV